MPKTKSKSSRRWLKEHFNDRFVKQAQKAGYRSRAVYKLEAIQEKDKLFKSGMIVVDLGAAPGGWSQKLRELIGEKGRVIALDILPMAAIPEVEIIQGDFQEDIVFEQLLKRLEGTLVDCVLSDMAPNLSGIESVDQPCAMYLAELALDFSEKVLKSEGSFVVKIFQGVGSEAYLKHLKSLFTKVTVRKPEASRARSSEVYLVAKGYKNKL